MLKAEALVVTLDRHRAVDGLDLFVGQGTVYALLGGNGAGKTTTINALLGFVPPSGGQVSVDGLSPTRDADAVRARVAYLPENVALYPYLTGLENLRYFCALAGRPLAASQAQERLAQAGLPPDAAGQRVSRYSKGMRQKTGLAIAYAKQARALLLDEPTSGLDPGAANEFAARIRGCAAAGMAVLMVTHDLFNARQVADRIGILRQGRCVAEFAAQAVDHGELERMYLAHARAQA